MDNTKLIIEDTLYEELVDYVCEREDVSFANIQRQFRIGCNRIEMVMERLIEDGIIEDCAVRGKYRVIGRTGSSLHVQSNKWKQLSKGFAESYNSLTRIFLKKCFSDNSKQNVVLSPFSILVLLSMLAGSTDGNTRDEIMAMISDTGDYDNEKETIRVLSELIESGGKLHSANAVCVKEKIVDTINAEYIEELQKCYSGELFSSSNMVRDVNNWIAEKTNGMIKDVVDESAEEMLACIINAIAFESKWSEEYEEDQIRDEKFHNADRTNKTVPMLHSTEWKYIEQEMYTGFIKDYKGLNYSFMGLLPRKKGISQIHRCLRDINFTEVFANAGACDVDVTIPEFRYTSDYDISNHCIDMGIKQAFSEEADFSPLSSEWLKVEKILHSARIELDRCGTKAAAVTVTEVFAGCAYAFWDRKEVKLDRPFIFAIMHNETKLPIFVGVVNQI